MSDSDTALRDEEMFSDELPDTVLEVAGSKCWEGPEFRYGCILLGNRHLPLLSCALTEAYNSAPSRQPQKVSGRSKLYAFLVGPGRPRVPAKFRGDKASPGLVDSGSNTQRCPSELASKRRVWGKAEPLVLIHELAALLCVALPQR